MGILSISESTIMFMPPESSREGSKYGHEDDKPMFV